MGDKDAPLARSPHSIQRQLLGCLRGRQRNTKLRKSLSSRKDTGTRQVCWSQSRTHVPRHSSQGDAESMPFPLNLGRPVTASASREWWFTALWDTQTRWKAPMGTFHSQSPGPSSSQHAGTRRAILAPIIGVTPTETLGLMEQRHSSVLCLVQIPDPRNSRA